MKGSLQGLPGPWQVARLLQVQHSSSNDGSSLHEGSSSSSDASSMSCSRSSSSSSTGGTNSPRRRSKVHLMQQTEFSNFEACICTQEISWQYDLQWTR